MASESSGGGAATAGRAKVLNDKRRKKPVGGAAGIPFKSGFRTARGQAQFKRGGGVNRKAPGTR